MYPVRSLVSLRSQRMLVRTYAPLLRQQQIDEAEIMAKDLTNKSYASKRNKLDYSWQEKSQKQIEDEYNDRMEKMAKLSAMFQGLFVVFGVAAAATLYYKWPSIKGWWMMRDMRVEDNVIEKLTASKKKKSLKEIPIVAASEPAGDVPGVYYWGKRLGEDNSASRFPLRVPWFDNKYLLDIALAPKGMNLAIDENGDLFSWDTRSCKRLLSGQNLVKVAISNNVGYALNKRGELLVIPHNNAKLVEDHTSSRRSWLLPYKLRYYYDWKIDTTDAFASAKGSKIVQFSVGKEHLVFITNNGRAYSCATGVGQTANSRSKGQFGIPTFSQFDRFPDRNKAYEIELLNNTVTAEGNVKQRIIKQVSCGNYHTLAVTATGELYGFGSNTYGQLGLPISYDMEYVSFPRRVVNFRAYLPTDHVSCIEAQCGGDTSIIAMLSHTMQDFQANKLGDNPATIQKKPIYFAFGNGIHGQHGNGHYAHSRNEATIVKLEKALENQADKEVNVDTLHCGGKHVMCKLTNGNVLTWGGNDSGQLGNWKKIQSAQPIPIPALIEPGVDYSKEPSLALTSSLQLSEHQRLALGESSSCIYWKR
ncbi:HDL558Cp [Eremothecium sinecaudum]|uniref:HDL558Cp n=1 Tax=Eremothecium sinecaudum TaxID=45286 RepID=A0A0X8HQM7_9SACH|nr:HDL558Cp [Eremothecium sinecaudum]AMD20186.1 HDL558Cp [Eremothecium sinecaudum]